MRKADFDRQFIAQVKSNLNIYAKNGRLDVPMIKEEYNNTIDSLHKDGEITEHQVNNWCCPKQAYSFKIN